MQRVLRRIAIHGGLTALLLAVVGFMLAELASMWLAASPGTRTATGDPVASTDVNGETTATLRSHMPLFMAVWGFVFVALGEVTLHLWRGRKPAPPPAADPRQQADETEKLLLELLAQAEAARQGAGDGSQGSGVGGQEPGTTPAPAAAPPPATAS